jgi:hypothetical protein
MLPKLESNLQQEIFIYYNNNYCLKHHENRAIIFSIPNGGTRNKREAVSLKKTGLLPGASDLIVITPKGKLMFVELKVNPVGKLGLIVYVSVPNPPIAVTGRNAVND